MGIRLSNGIARRGVSTLEGGILPAEDIPVEKRGQTRAEDGDRQPDEHLIDAQGDGQDGEQQPERQPGAKPCQDTPNSAASQVGRIEPEEGAAEHHPLDTEIEQPRLLTHGLTEGGHHQWRRRHEPRRQHGGEEGE